MRSSPQLRVIVRTTFQEKCQLTKILPALPINAHKSDTFPAIPCEYLSPSLVPAPAPGYATHSAKLRVGEQPRLPGDLTRDGLRLAGRELQNKNRDLMLPHLATGLAHSSRSLSRH